MAILSCQGTFNFKGSNMLHFLSLCAICQGLCSLSVPGIQERVELYAILRTAAAAESLQSCPTLCDPIDGSPPGCPIPGASPGKNTGVGCHFLLQCIKVKVKSLSLVRPSVTPWTAAHQAPPSMGFSRQEYWSGVPLPSLCNI